MPSNKQPINKITLSDGKTTRWELITDGPPDPETGKRKQIRRRFLTQKEAKAELSRVRHESNTGTFVAPRKVTLGEYLDTWIAGHVRDLEAATASNYRTALLPVRERLGERELQSIIKKDLDELADWMITSGRRRGGKPGTGLSPRSVTMTLNTLQTALDLAVSERKISINPARLVKRPKRVKPMHQLWSDAEEDAFFLYTAQDRLSAVIELFSRALRPEELCGIRWSDIDLAGKSAAVGVHVRTLVDGAPGEQSAKSEAGIRLLPLDDDLTARLRRWHAAQCAEKLAAGAAWVEGSDGGYVLADELGQPWLPDKLRRRMHRLMDLAGVPKIKPYDAMRHASASRMARHGVPAQNIAAWLGHTDAAFTYRTYIHSRAEDLAEARDALTRKTA